MVGREQLRGVPGGDPADWNGRAGGQGAVHVHDRAYAHLAASADGRPWKDRDLVARNTSSSIVAPFTWACDFHEHVLAEPGRVAAATAHKRVLHDYRAGADLDAPALRGQHRAEQDPASSPTLTSPQSTALGAT